MSLGNFPEVARVLRCWLCYDAQRMIAEIFPELYDVEGRRAFAPGRRARRVGFRPTAHMERYVAQPLWATRPVCTRGENLNAL